MSRRGGTPANVQRVPSNPNVQARDLARSKPVGRWVSTFHYIVCHTAGFKCANIWNVGSQRVLFRGRILSDSGSACALTISTPDISFPSISVRSSHCALSSSAPSLCAPDQKGLKSSGATDSGNVKLVAKPWRTLSNYLMTKFPPGKSLKKPWVCLWSAGNTGNSAGTRENNEGWKFLT